MGKTVRSLIALALVALTVFSPAAALAQGALLQGGPVTPGHAPMYVNSGNQQPIVMDSGPASGGVAGLGFDELLLSVRGTGTPPYVSAGSGPNGENFCNYDAPTNNPNGYHYLCMSPNVDGAGLISYGAGGIAPEQSLNLMVNGETYEFPFILSGVVGPANTTVGNIAIWDNTTGTLLGQASRITEAQLPSVAASTVLCNSTLAPAGATACAALPTAMAIPGGQLVPSSVTSTQILNSTVSNAKLATMGTQTIKCNATGGTTNPQDCTAAQVAGIIGVRTVLSSNTTYYLSPAGNDGNDGSVGSPWKTCAHARDVIYQDLDLNGFTVTIQLAFGTSGAPVTFTSAELTNCIFDGMPLGAGAGSGLAPIVIQGDPSRTSLAAPPNTVILSTTTGACLSAENGAVVQIKFVWLKCVYNIASYTGAKVYTQDVISDGVPVANSVHFYANQFGYIEINGNTYFAQTDGGLDTPEAILEAKHMGSIRLQGQPTAGTFYLLSALTPSIAFAYVENMGELTATGNLQSTGFDHNGFNVVGPCYLVTASSSVQWITGTTTCSTNGSPTLSFPGNSAGNTPGRLQQGGQFFTSVQGQTFTPTLTFGGGSTGITYSLQTGRYTITAAGVCLSATVILTNKGSSTGVAALVLPATLPISVASGPNNPMVMTQTTVTYTGSTKAQLGTNTRTILLFADNGGLTQLDDTAFANTSSVSVSGCYFQI